MALTIEVYLGSALAETSWALGEFSRSVREAAFDELADVVLDDLEEAYPDADIEVTCKPGIERLRGEDTDIYTSGLNDDNAAFMAETVQEAVHQIAERFWEDVDLEDIERSVRDSIEEDEAC